MHKFCYFGLKSATELQFLIVEIERGTANFKQPSDRKGMDSTVF